MPWKLWIPNLFTLANLMAGAIILLFNHSLSDIEITSLLLLAAVCDLLDGWVARALGATSAMGAQLDSLADLISFGMVPAWLAWQSAPTPHLGWWCLIIPAFSALRLARFNVSEPTGPFFHGLPTPANALLWLGAFLIHKEMHVWPETLWLITVWASAILLVSNAPFLSLKTGKLRLIAVILGVLIAVIIAFPNAFSIPFILTLYALVSWIAYKRLMLRDPQK